MRRVSLFMHDFSGGGVEKMRLALAGALTSAGCEVSIIVVNADGPLAALVPASVRVFDMQKRRLLQAMPRLRRYLQNERPDVLVSSLDHNNIAALLACATTRTGTRLVICQHNALSEEMRIGWKYRAVPLLYRLLAPMADAIVAVSRGVAGRSGGAYRLAPQVHYSDRKSGHPIQRPSRAMPTHAPMDA